MLRKQSERIARQERGQRRALIVFVAAFALLLGFCAFAGVRILSLPTTLIAAGRVEDYTDKQPRRYNVPKLKVSEMIQRRDSLASEDVIYVRRDSDNGWIALLGVDTLSGCFLYWDEQAGLFQDVSCLGARYTPDGRYLDGLQSGEPPQNMARLPVDVRDDQVFIRDEILRER